MWQWRHGSRCGLMAFQVAVENGARAVGRPREPPSPGGASRGKRNCTANAVPLEKSGEVCRGESAADSRNNRFVFENHIQILPRARATTASHEDLHCRRVTRRYLPQRLHPARKSAALPAPHQVHTHFISGRTSQWP